ncbi:MAG: PqqD family protein [Bacteroidales bacterium]|nr:PqqD family protein [Bacteroidales bacterium]
MRINSHFKLRRVADDHIVILQGHSAGDTTRVLQLNATAVYLWRQLQDRDFALDEVASLLTTRYEVDSNAAMRDALQWVDLLSQHNLITADA